MDFHQIKSIPTFDRTHPNSANTYNHPLRFISPCSVLMIKDLQPEEFKYYLEILPRAPIILLSLSEEMLPLLIPNISSLPFTIYEISEPDISSLGHLEVTLWCGKPRLLRNFWRKRFLISLDEMLSNCAGLNERLASLSFKASAYGVTPYVSTRKSPIGGINIEALDIIAEHYGFDLEVYPMKSWGWMRGYNNGTNGVIGEVFGFP